MDAWKRDATKRLSSRIEIDDAYLGGERSGGLRGRGALARHRSSPPSRRPLKEGRFGSSYAEVTSFCAASIAGFANRSLDRIALSSAAAFSVSPASPMPGARIRSSPPGQDREGGTHAGVQMGQHRTRQHRYRPSREPTAPSTASMSRATSPNSNTASIDDMIWRH